MLPQPSVAQLRPALKLALDRAAAAPAGRTLPGRVRSLVGSRRLPANWTVTMLRALDEEDAFRSWVAEDASEETLGRVAWLWLTRPEGWSDELAALVEGAAVAEELDKEVRSAVQRADALERDLAAVREELAQARAAQSAMEADAQQQREEAAKAVAEARKELSLELSAAQEGIASLETAQAAWREERESLEQEVGDLGRRLDRSDQRGRDAVAEAARLAALVDSLTGQREVERAESGRRVAAVEGRLAAAADALRRATTASGQVDRALSEAGAALGLSAGRDGGSSPGLGPPGSASPAPAGTDPFPAGGAGRSVGGALGGALGGAAGGERPAKRAGPGSGRGSAARSAGGSAGRTAGRTAGRALPLPPGVFDDSPEAAAYLVRAPGVHLVVDGYNVALTSWGLTRPDRGAVDDLAELRRRLLDALGELAVRLQRAVTVVFDGRDSGGRVTAGGPARRWLRILFSPSTVEADELILEAVRQLRPEGPVVVATNDREVRDGARQLGANVLSVNQLLGVLNRHTLM